MSGLKFIVKAHLLQEFVASLEPDGGTQLFFEVDFDGTSGKIVPSLTVSNYPEVGVPFNENCVQQSERLEISSKLSLCPWPPGCVVND